MRADTARNAALRGEQDAGIRTADPRYRVNSPPNRHGIKRAGPKTGSLVCEGPYGWTPARASRPR